MLFYYLLCINLFSFSVVFIDKKLAEKRKRRISENFLFLCAFILGSPGIYSGMLIFRHKTKKYKFSVGIPVLILLQSILSFYLYNTFPWR